MDKKYLKKLEQQNKTNPGHKNDSYVPPLRPRSAVFKSKKDYNRTKNKEDIRKGKFDE